MTVSERNRERPSNGMLASFVLSESEIEAEQFPPKFKSGC